MEEKFLYTTDDLEKLLSMCKRVILEEVKAGRLKSIKYGNKFYYTKEYIVEFINLLKSDGGTNDE